MFKRLASAAIVFGMLAGAPPVAAQAQHQMPGQSTCAVRDQVVDRLSERFGETPAGIGLSNPNALVEVWTSDETGTWTILVTRADGVSCVVASGSNWRDAAPQIMGIRVNG
ncbi:MAG: hypothetical protein AAGE18_13655 [Pseudomonadota bacterium]